MPQASARHWATCSSTITVTINSKEPPSVTRPSHSIHTHFAAPIGFGLVVALVAAGCGSGDDELAATSDCSVDEVDGDLALYNWAEYIDPDDLDRFGDEFGIDVTMGVFDSNEAMQPIIAAGNSGYDVIVPSDYMVEIMAASGSLLPLDTSLLPNLSNLATEFTGLDYDPDGTYSVPYQAGTTGLAVDTAVVGNDFDRSWGLVFDPEMSAPYAGKISLLNDPRETLGAALRYLGYSLNTTDEAELEEAADLVAATRDRLAAFDTDSSDELLVTGETAIAHGYSGNMFGQFTETDDPERYEYFVPKEGGTRFIDTMAIPFDAPHPCTAHTFMNWILDADNGAALTNWNYYTTPNAAARPGLDDELLDFIEDPDVVVGGADSLELIEDTGDFEINYSDAFITAKG